MGPAPPWGRARWQDRSLAGSRPDLMQRARARGGRGGNAEQLGAVLAEHAAQLRLGHAAELLLDEQARARPLRAVAGVGVVRGPHDAVDADLVAAFDREGVDLERAPH